MNVGEIEYTVAVDTRDSIQASEKVDKSLREMQGEMRNTEKSAEKLNTGLSKLAKGIAALALGAAVKSLAQQVQAYNTMSERVRMATDSVEEFDMVQQRLRETADGTYRSLAEAQEVYIGVSSSLKGMGYSANQAMDVVDSLSYAFVANATNAQRAESAMNALTMATTTGKVTSMQWMSLMNAVPTVVDDIAKATGKTANEVRELGATGKLAAAELVEGLRQSVEKNKEASDSMANDFTDASVRMNNAIVSVLAGLEQQTGALDTLTNGIIDVANVITEFSQDAEKMAGVLKAAEVAGASFAAVMTARVLTAVFASGKAMYDATIGAQRKAAADVQAAQAAAALAAQELVKARAAAAAAVGLGHHAAMVEALAAAESRATLATRTLTTAITAQSGVMTIAQRAAAGLGTAMSFLGGPTGIILMVAAAFVTMGNSASASQAEIDQLTQGIENLSGKTLEYRKIQIQEEMEKQEKAAAKLERKYKDMQQQIDSGLTRSDSFRRKLAETGAQMETARTQASALAEGLEKVNAQLEGRTAKVSDDAGAPIQPAAAKTESDEFKKLEQGFLNQIELAKKTGLARAELAALQKLGADATDEERQRITELVGQLHKLEESQKAAEKATQEKAKALEESKRATQENAETIKQLEERLHQTTLSADELIQRQAELSLNDYATPEQIERVRELALQIKTAQEEAEQLERRKKAFGDDAAGTIRGDVTPLSGGRFDDGTARYEAEAQAEERRYQEQIKRMQEAEELKIEVAGGYDLMREELYQEHIDRMNQIDQARRDAQLEQWSSGFGQMASDLEAFATVFANENSAMFKIAKAAAITQTIIDTYKGAQAAYAAMAGIPVVGPALGVTAAAAAVGAGMARVAQIRGQSMGGGRRYGGGVAGDKYYKVNEGGLPEIFKGSDGNQYLMPNQRGEVVSNKDATSSNTSNKTLNLTQNITMRQDNGNYSDKQVAMKAAQMQSIAEARFG